MLTLFGSLRVFLALEPCDMRKSSYSLHALVVSQLGEDPRGGAVFAFTNRTRTLIKLLLWDGSGLWVHAKRLEKGTLCWPKPSDGSAGKLKLAPEALAMLTDGVDLKGGRGWARGMSASDPACPRYGIHRRWHHLNDTGTGAAACRPYRAS